MQRFSVNASATVQTLSLGQQQVFELQTQNISSGGAFFPREVPLLAGQKVRITFSLAISALEQFHDLPKKTRILTEGEVIRSTKQGMAVRFAGPYSMSPGTA